MCLKLFFSSIVSRWSLGAILSLLWLVCMLESKCPSLRVYLRIEPKNNSSQQYQSLDFVILLEIKEIIHIGFQIQDKDRQNTGYLHHIGITYGELLKESWRSCPYCRVRIKELLLKETIGRVVTNYDTLSNHIAICREFLFSY